MTMIHRALLIRRLRRGLALAAALAPLALAGCGKSATPTQPTPLPPLRGVVLLTATFDTLTAGASVQMVAVALDSATGDTLRDLALTWRTNDASVATVSTTGLVTGRAEGNARIIVSGNDRADTAFVFVRPAQSGWIVVSNSQATEDLNGVFFLSSGRTGWVVGNGGVILKSSDAGTTWSRQTPSLFNLHGVYFSGATGYAVGASGAILKSDDLGKTWARLIVSEAGGRTLRDVFLTDTSHVFIVGDFGLLLTGTVDGTGRLTWKAFPTSIVTPLNSIAFAGSSTGWVVGDAGIVFGTRDGGVSWYRVPPAEVGTSVNLSGVTRRVQPSKLGDAGAVAVGQNGTVARAVTTQDSLAWDVRNAGGNYQLTGVSLPIGQTVFATGANLGQGAVLRSDNGGATWSVQDTRAAAALNDLIFVDVLRGWAVGDNGTIRHTATGGLP
jgi:photosystem II stability/assembly factor-like uncharacterized protein